MHPFPNVVRWRPSDGNNENDHGKFQTYVEAAWAFRCAKRFRVVRVVASLATAGSKDEVRENLGNGVYAGDTSSNFSNLHGHG